MNKDKVFYGIGVIVIVVLIIAIVIGLGVKLIKNNNNIINRECDIKGNINSKGEKIYHLKGCSSYDKTIVSEDLGEKGFCSENDAIMAGGRKAEKCR